MLGRVKAAKDADALIYDPASGKVLVSCGDANVMIPISADVDPAAGKADAAVSLGGKPEGLAADGQGKVYINLKDKDQVAVVDSRHEGHRQVADRPGRQTRRHGDGPPARRACLSAAGILKNCS